MRPTVFVVAAVLSTIATDGLLAQPQAAPPPQTIPGVQQTPGPRSPAQPAAPVRDAGGRPPAAPPGTSTLTGLVTTDTGQPAVGARVMAGGEGPSRMATTDARGRFSLTALRAGRYYVTVSKPGYVTVTYGQRRVNSQGTPIPLGEGETRDIAVPLPRGGVITGMVLDERGEPAVNAVVRVMRFMPGAGARRPQQVGGDNTDDRGIYRIHSLQPGDYAICATFRGSGPQNDAQRMQMEMDGLRRSMANAPSAGARQQMAARLADLQAQMPAQNEPATGYASVCFPGSSLTASTMVPVSAGEEKTGIDLQMLMTQVARIEGQVVAPPGVELRNVQMNLASEDEAATPIDRNFAQVDEQGKFVFESIPPGGYKIVARSMPGNHGPPGPAGVPPQQPPRLWANASVTVAGQDITGLVLELQRGATISGQVTIQATATPPPADLSRMMISVFPSAPESQAMMMGGGMSQAQVEANGRFTISDVFPGSYRISATLPGAPAASTWVVQSITVGGEDALDMPLDVKGSRSINGMAVTMTDRITELTGLVVDDKGKPATEHTLVLYPVDEKYWFFQSRRIRTTRAGEDGRFTFRVVPPGDYRLATLVDPEPGAWYEKAVLSDLESTAVRLSLAEGEKKVENVRVR
jgi:hypothetical protein